MEPGMEPTCSSTAGSCPRSRIGVAENSNHLSMSPACILQVFLGTGEGSTPSPRSTSWQCDGFPPE